jgi:hypothetical protein
MTAQHPALRTADRLSETERIVSAVRQAGTSIKTGRTSAILGDTSTTGALGQIQRLFRAYEPLAYQLPWQILDYVEILSTYNPDYSQAVENIKMLANSGHELFVDAASELEVRRTKELLESKASSIQEPHGGIDGVIDKLLDQAATFGAMCGEWVLNEDMTDIVDFADLNPKKIRFFWHEELQRYVPYQKVTTKQAKEAADKGQEIRGDCVRLNEMTFRYYAFDAAPGSPYGVPPFLAALGNIAIQRDMVHNMAQIVKKIGLLGVVDLTIERLQPIPGETDEQYASRAGAYLEAYVTIAEDMVKEGGIVHFDDVTANTWQIGGNAAGATNIHKANEEMVFSGLKSMPSVQGRSYSTTETYAGVAYEIILRNTFKYQRACKRMIESGYHLIAALNGRNPTSIRLSFKTNRSLNRLQEAQAKKVEIGNAFMLWLLGIIDQHGLAQELGYNEPKTEMAEPPESLLGIQSAHAVSEYITSVLADTEVEFGEGDEPRGKIEEEADEREEESEG